MSEAIPAASLTPGSWTARWGAWVISIRTDEDDRWRVRVWSWATGARVQVGKRAILSTPGEAVASACALLREHGARVFVDGRDRGLEDWLSFSKT
jgi:hypothetical protein